MSRWFGASARSTEESLQGGRSWVDGELWREDRADADGASSVASRQPAMDFDFSKTEIVRTVRTPRHSGVKKPQAVEQVSLKRRGDRTAGIGRFMQVNRTIDIGRGNDYRVVQSPRQVSADYDLWKGPSGIVTFFLGG